MTDLVRERQSPQSQLVLGLVLLTFGLLWTLDSLSVMETGNVLRWWPVLLIWLGVAKLTGRGASRNPTVGILALVVGAGMTLDRLGVINFGFDLIWPFAILLLGASLVARAIRRKSDADGNPHWSDSNSMAILSGVTQRSRVQNYRGGSVSAVMGAVELDLREARPEGSEVIIELLVFMGGVDIIVPHDWAVEVQTVPLMGAIEHKSDGIPIGVPRTTLVIRGAVIMGGLEIKN